MKEMFIKYNPYRLVTEILIDGKPPTQKSKLNVGDRRLQEWIEDLPNIIFDEYRAERFKIVFQGTVLDYEDVEAMAEEAKRGVYKNRVFHIETEQIPAMEAADKEAAVSEIFDEIQSGPFEELKQPDVVRAFNMAKSSDFEVNVVATMSAGKSTLINALLRQKLMPAKQEACTATITEIKDTDGECFTAEAYDPDGALVGKYPNLTFEIMEKLNSDPKVSKILAEGNIPFVSSEDVSLVLVDTPGPNNSRDPEHRAATYRMLSESSKAVVLYILNATQLAVNDDYNLLSHVAASMRVGGKQSRDRFIFVVNKLDEFKKGEDSIDAAIAKVREYLKDNGIENANIFPASALTALNIRTVLAESDDDSDDEVYEAKGKVRKFNNNPEMHFEEKAPLTPSFRKLLEERLQEADDNGKALIHCGIVPVEMAIQTYVRKYAKTAKIRNIVDTFSKRLESAGSFETTKKDIAENQDKQNEILENIDIIRRKLASGDEAKAFKKRIDQINYDGEINKLANNIIKPAQERLTEELSAPESRISENEARIVCGAFARLSENLLSEIQVKFEDLITNHVTKNADKLLEEYRKKIAELAQDLNISGIAISPFEIMEGDIEDLANFDNIMDAAMGAAKRTESSWEVVGQHKEYKEVFGFRRWLNRKLGTSFNVNYDLIDDYDWVEHTYIDRTVLAQKYLAPVQEALHIYKNAAVEYAKAQTENVRENFKKKFDELNNVLNRKLKELEDYTKDSENLAARIEESQRRLNWLETIQAKIMSILDI